MPGIQGPQPMTGQLVDAPGWQLCGLCGGDIGNGTPARVLIGEHGMRFYFHTSQLGPSVSVDSVSPCWERYQRALDQAAPEQHP